MISLSSCWSVSAADGKLQEQLNAVQKEITRLEYQNNELDQVGPSGSPLWQCRDSAPTFRKMQPCCQRDPGSCLPQALCVCVNDIVLCSVSGSSGGKGNQRRTEELQSKVMKQAEELVEMHKKVGEVTTQLAELTTQLRKKDNDLVKKDERCVEWCVQCE